MKKIKKEKDFFDDIKKEFNEKDFDEISEDDISNINFERSLEKSLIDLERFVISAYASQCTVLTLLLDKKIITEKEFMDRKMDIMGIEEISNLFKQLHIKEKIFKEREKI